jgi:cell division protein FtsB
LLWESTDSYLTGLAALVFALTLFNRGLADRVSAWEGVSPLWSLAPVALLFLYGLMRANYAEFRKVENERDGLRADLRDAVRGREELRQENKELAADNDKLEKDLAAERASSRAPFSKEELANRHLSNRPFYITDLTRSDTMVRRWTFEDCDILGPAVVAPLVGTVIENPTYVGDRPEHIEWRTSPERAEHIGAIGLEDCVIRRCTFINIGVVVNPERGSGSENGG